MNALLEKLFTETDPEEFQETANELLRQTQAQPEAWLDELDQAYERAKFESHDAEAHFRDAEEGLAEVEFHFSMGEAASKQEVFEAKATAWDTFWNHRRALKTYGEIYSLIGNVGQILANAEAATQLYTETIPTISGEVITPRDYLEHSCVCPSCRKDLDRVFKFLDIEARQSGRDYPTAEMQAMARVLTNSD